MSSYRMRFRRGSRDEPEINLIPFIDVLLVVLIFLMLSTTYTKLTEMQLRLPTAATEAQRGYLNEVIVAVAADGRYAVNELPLPDRSVDSIAIAMGIAAKGSNNSVLIISADANASHQSVVTVMEAARRAGLSQVTFAAQTTAQAGR